MPKEDQATMTGEFRTAKGWRIIIYIFSPLLIWLFAYGGIVSFNSETYNPTVYLIVVPVSFGGTVLFTYGLIETIKGRLVVGTNSISRISAFGTRTLEFREIKGFRADSNYIHIVSNSENKRSIRITAYIERSDQLLNWLTGNFLELDSHEASEEEKQILTDDAFGINEHAREHRLNEAKRIAKYINIIGGLSGAWLWFYPRPYSLSLAAGIILPAIAFLSLYVYRGLIRFDEQKNSAHPSILYGFLFPSGGLIIRAILDFEILEYKSLWLAIGIATITLTVLLGIWTRQFKFNTLVDYLTTLSLAGMIFGYSFGAYVVSNCLFDPTEPQVFQSEVTDKEISSGKSTTYYLYLEPWGPRTEIERVSVTRDQYEATEPGETVDVYLRQGLYGTPWFYVVTE